MPMLLVMMKDAGGCTYDLQQHALPGFSAIPRQSTPCQVYSLSFLYYDDLPLPLHICRRIW